MPASFGLEPSDRTIHLEHTFLLMYYMGFSYVETYNIPIQYRIWFINRVQEELKKANEKGDGQSRAAHDNSAEARSMMGRSRAQVPSKLRRFT